jgi:energy-coupling factor transporter ATP-binding protein EcfA2
MGRGFSEHQSGLPNQDGAEPLRVAGISKQFGHKLALDDVSLSVRAGEAVAVVGENGCGKTTLLRVCAGLIRPDAGRVSVRARVGYCPQQPGLFDLLSAEEHLALFAPAVGLSREQALRDGQELLAEFAGTASQTRGFAVDSRGLGTEIAFVPDRPPGWSLEPVDEALVCTTLGDQLVQRLHEGTDRRRPLGEAARVENDDPAVVATLAAEPPIELEEVVAVVRHDRSLGRLRVPKQLLVRKASKLAPPTRRLHIALAHPELLGHDRRDHLIKQQLHRVMLCSRQRSSAASASSSFRRIRSSISAGYSL